MPLKIVRNDITKMNTEAIVNTANSHVLVGPGCDSAVYKAAGYDELLRYRKEKVGEVEEGQCFITPGFNLEAKYIIHAVSPAYQGGEKGEEEKLRACYRNSLRLALDRSIKSIAFPLISTGAFGYPKEEGMRIAVDEINSFLLVFDMTVYLVVFDEKATALGEKLYPDLESYINRKYVEEKKEEEYFFNHGDGARPEFPGQRNSAVLPRLATPMPRRMPAMSAPYMESAHKPIEEDSQVEGAISSWNEGIIFDEEHESKLNERMSHLTDTFSQYLLYLIQEKKMENAEVWKRAIVDKKVFSKIKNNPDYHPQKLTALCLCIGAKLNLDETKDLLARAGYALSTCDKTDIIFSYFIENKIYDMIELDIQLEEHGLPCIIA